MTKDLEIVKEEIFPIVTEAKRVMVIDEKSKAKAAEVLSRLNKWSDSLVEDREKITKPLNEALREVRGKYKPLETVLSEGIEIVREKIGAYQTEMLRLKAEEEAKIAARVGEGKGKLKVETAVRQIESLEKPDETVVTDSGMVKFRTDKVLKVNDISSIPDEYFVLDEKAVTKALREGAIVPGAVLVEVQTVVNSR